MDMSTFVFSPIYAIGHSVGMIVALLVQMVSGVVLPDTIIDTIGFLAIMTMLLLLADKAKKLTWSLVTICWALLIIKIGMLMGKPIIVFN